MKMMRGTWWTLILVAMLFLAGCGGDDDDNDSGAPVDDDTADDDATDDDATDDDAGDDDTWPPLPDDDSADDDTGDDDTEICDEDVLIGSTYDESPTGGPLREKAEAYDSWHEAWHQPNYGSTVGVVFTSDDRDEAEWYFDLGDSCIWTGTYLASQALRYHVTGDAQAKANAIKAASSLSRHLHVTGRPGFIARYVGPQSDPTYGDVAANCVNDENWHCVDSGEFDGDFWIGNTSRDQYTGWFFGMSLAYDLVDDETMRAQIESDVAEVLDELIDTDWWITDVDDIPTTAGPNVLPTQQQAWSLIGWNITGDATYREIYEKWALPENQLFYRLMNISIMNRYAQHYGLNLAHQNAFNLLRLSRPDCDINEFIREVFTTQVHYHIDLSHNAFYTQIHMAQSQLDDTSDYWDDQLAQMTEDLEDFRPAPNYRYAVDPPDAPLDPISVILHDLQVQYPFLEEVFGGVDYQALDAYPVFYQCATDFLWQRNPWAIECGAVENIRDVNPGVDYLVAYWLASAYGYVTKDQ
ncbi:MAG: hypothetical protein IT350_10595 [Deltaproteobacteria bacterium]|nr:hypothetical protein [Deltaproteobacteria bacterium]